MPLTIPQSPSRRRVMAAILGAGATGITRTQVVQATGLASKTVGMYMRNLRSAGETFAGLRTPDTGRCHPYVAAEHYPAYCQQQGLPVPSALIASLQAKAEQKAREQAQLQARPRAAGPSAINAKALPMMGSPYRGAVLMALNAATGPLTTSELSLAAGVGINSVRSVIDSLLRDGLVANAGTAQRSRWAPSTPEQRPASTASRLSYDRVCNSRQPTITARDLPTMGSTRADAGDHLRALSLRADGRFAHRAPLLIASTARGGVRPC